MNGFCEDKNHAKEAEEMTGNSTPKKWSAEVTEKSTALDLEEGVFTWDDPKRIARSLQYSAEASTRRKSSPYRSAMSMLTFYINRAGSHLDKKQKQVLEQAKQELRRLYGKE
jgi:hemerythrin-like domain-containing protein